VERYQAKLEHRESKMPRARVVYGNEIQHKTKSLEILVLNFIYHYQFLSSRRDNATGEESANMIDLILFLVVISLLTDEFHRVVRGVRVAASSYGQLTVAVDPRADGVI